MTPLFTLIHPSRERAEKSYNNFRLWHHRYSGIAGNLEIIISVDEGDPQLTEYMRRYEPQHLLIGPNKSSVEAINRAAAKSTGQILIVIAEDTDCPVHWHTEILNVVEGKRDWILKTQDGIQNWICTLPIMDRDYYNRFGYIYYPGYQHLFCDTELTCVADILGRKITSNLLFPHNHYSIGKATLDGVYSKNDRTNEQGEKLFLERYARNFDLPPGNKIQDKGMIDWLKKRHVA